MVVSATDWEQIFSGDLFTFVCGDGRKAPRRTFHIHAGLVAQVSRPLERLINNGRMVEAIERRVHLVDVNPETFGLFTQWLYSGTYQITELEHAAFSAPPSPEAEECYCIRCGSLAASRSSELWPFCSVLCCRAHCGRKSSVWRYCVQCGVPEFVNKDDMWLRCEDCGKMKARSGKDAGALDEPLSDASAIHSSFNNKVGMTQAAYRVDWNADDTLQNNKKHLHHLFARIKLYVFADMFMIDKLKEKCLQELQGGTKGCKLVTANGLARADQAVSNPAWNGWAGIYDGVEALPGVKIIEAISHDLSMAGTDLEVFEAFRQLLGSNRELAYMLYLSRGDRVD